MRLRVQLFARAKDLVGATSVTLELPEGATVAQVRRRLAEERPALAALLERSVLAVDNEFADDNTIVPTGAEIALLPPVSGGAPTSEVGV